MATRFEPNWFKPVTPVGVGFIRIGGPHDGGYVLADDIDGIGRMISIGVGSDASFDLDMAERGANVILIDGTVSGPPINHDRFQFVHAMWDEKKTGIKWFTAQGSTDQILKFDTEGAEWECLPRIHPDELLPFRQIACELHWLDKKFDPAAMGRLFVHHELVHVHACNFIDTFEHDGKEWPQVIECTFLRKDRASFSDDIPTLPRPQDSPCNQYAPEIPVPIG